MEPWARYTISFLGPFFVVLALTPIAGRMARRYRILDHPKPNKIHRRATPYLGGVAVAVGLVSVAAVTSGLASQILTVLACTIVVCGLGLVDDWHGAGPVVKLLVEAAAGTALWVVGIGAGVFGTTALDLPLTIAWVIVVTNAINLVDNMDGLASGITAAAALAFFAIAAARGEFLVASLAMAVAGASLGFLAFNFPPARIFLGDAGSLPLGFLLASLGLQLDLMGPSAQIRVAIPVLAVAVPLLDMLVVVTVRLRERRPIYLGGTDHSSHRLAAGGMSSREVALLFIAVQAACGALAFTLSRAPRGTVSVAAGAIAALGLAAWAKLTSMSAQPGARPTQQDRDVPLELDLALLGPVASSEGDARDA